ncbi:hypothetical protein [Intrasporangium chromatireducens]|uniref:hypothetical protein n=1 Tax=Intrasporangium chromatireducens TaxID=1386088 RepID=UPI0004B21F8E|nr:hypothetical protein [Intrasporangium chromatireducens]
MQLATVVMDAGGRFIDWGVLHVSVGNLIVVLVMLVVFALVLVLPFPGEREEQPRGGSR